MSFLLSVFVEDFAAVVEPVCSALEPVDADSCSESPVFEDLSIDGCPKSDR